MQSILQYASKGLKGARKWQERLILPTLFTPMHHLLSTMSDCGIEIRLTAAGIENLWTHINICLVCMEVHEETWWSTFLITVGDVKAAYLRVQTAAGGGGETDCGIMWQKMQWIF